MTLQECIAGALSRNLQIKAQDIASEEKKEAYREAAFAHLPSIALYGTGNFNWGRSVDMQELVIIKNQLTKAVNVSIGAGWEIFNGFSLQYKRMAAHLEFDATELGGDRIRNDIALNVTKAYLQLILAEEMEENTRNEYDRILKEKERMIALVQAGSKPFSELRLIEAQVAGELSTMTSAQCERKSRIMKLMQLMDLPYDSSFHTVRSVDEETLMSVPLMTSEQIEDCVTANPSILELRKRAESAERKVSAAKGEAAPSISLSASYGTYYSDANKGKLGEQLRENRNPSVGVDITIPIFDRYKYTAQIKYSRLAHKKALLNVDMKKKELTETLQNALLEAESGFRKLDAAQKVMDARKETMEISSLKYLGGAIAILEFTTARNNYLKAKSDFIRTKWQYIFQLKVIDHYRGAPVVL